MKKYIKLGIVIAGFLITNMVVADDNHHPTAANKDMMMGMGSSTQMAQMMAQRMEMMKSKLKLNAKQEKDFDAFIQQKNAMMKSMMATKKAVMKNMQDMDMKGQKDMQGQLSMMDGQMMMMQMMSSISFEQRINMMQDHGNTMLAVSKAGKKFYSTLNSEQKKMLNDMPKQMQDMK